MHGVRETSVDLRASHAHIHMYKYVRIISYACVRVYIYICICMYDCSKMGLKLEEESLDQNHGVHWAMEFGCLFVYKKGWKGERGEEEDKASEFNHVRQDGPLSVCLSPFLPRQPHHNPYFLLSLFFLSLFQIY